MRAQRNITFTTCTRTNGCKHLTTTIQPTSTVRRLDQATRLLLKLLTAAPATETRSSATPSSIATSILTLHKACGNCGAHTMCLNRERSWMLMEFRFPALVLYRMVRSSPAHRHRLLSHCQHWQWRQCLRRLCPAIHSLFLRRQGIVHQNLRSTQSMMVVYRDT